MSDDPAQPVAPPTPQVPQPPPPRLSVVTCVRNGGAYLPEQLDSVLGQTLGDFELLLFDDGSTDDVPEVARRYAARDGRVRYHRRAAGNYVDRLNEALGLARADLVARCDGDDVCEPDRFATQAEYLDAHPDVVAVASRLTETDPLGVPLGVTDQPPDHEAIERALLGGNGWALAQPAAMFRRAAFHAVGGYRPQVRGVEDIDLFLRLARVGRLANLERPLVRYRRHLGSVNATLGGEQRRLMTRVLADAHAERGLPTPEIEFRQLPDPRLLLHRWGWNALGKGRPDVARRHAAALVRRMPTSADAWKLLACAVRGR